MALSFNSAPSFNSKLQAKPQIISRRCSGAFGLKINCIAACSGHCFGSRQSIKNNRPGLIPLAADSNQVATDPTDDKLSAKPSPLNSPVENTQVKSNKKDELGTQIAETSNGTGTTSDETGTVSSPRPPKRSPLTAREKLRAARVLNRYADSKPAKSEYGNRVLDALRESDKEGNKRPGLPEAPTNMLDDSKRGMPKQGLTFDFPGGIDLFFIVLSFVLISTTMFATTFIVWKLGAIHFNEY